MIENYLQNPILISQEELKCQLLKHFRKQMLQGYLTKKKIQHAEVLLKLLYME